MGTAIGVFVGQRRGLADLPLPLPAGFFDCFLQRFHQLSPSLFTITKYSTSSGL